MPEEEAASLFVKLRRQLLFPDASPQSVWVGDGDSDATVALTAMPPQHLDPAPVLDTEEEMWYWAEANAVSVGGCLGAAEVCGWWGG